jgi:hypothetical protein
VLAVTGERGRFAARLDSLAGAGMARGKKKQRGKKSLLSFFAEMKKSFIFASLSEIKQKTCPGH